MTNLVTTEEKQQWPETQLLPAADPYPDKTPFSILTRRYLIQSFTLASDGVQIIFPFARLMEQPTLSNYLSAFRYLRSGMKVDIQLVSTPMQFGLVQVSQLPFTSSTTDWNTFTQRSQADAHLLDISQQNMVTLTLPYLRPKLYHDLDAEDFKSWRVIVEALYVNAITTDSPTNVIVNVFAALENPETAGFIPEASFQSRDLGANPVGRAAELFSRVAKQAGPFLGALSGTDSSDVISKLSSIGGSEIQQGLQQGVQDSLNIASQLGVTMSQPENAKLALMGELSIPAVQGTNTASRLGDCREAKHDYLPGSHTTRLHKIAETPVLHQEFVFATTADILTIDASPFSDFSHSNYLLKMFKFWRGGSRILIRFCSSQMVSARFRITVFPAGLATDDVGAIGDVPSWIVTVKGSEEVCFAVPYLQIHAWSKSDLQDYVPPIIKVVLLDTLPQPFDKTVSVYCAVYKSADSDIKYCGLQSAVGGVFQSCVRDCMDRCEKMAARVTSSFGYQGGIEDTYSILGRFSTRGPDPSNHFPFPLKIQNTAHYQALDNFDYLSNLYKFYTGDTHVKILFSQAPANGIIEATIGNTKIDPGGADFKAGNGLVVSHQAVWPTLEMMFPYMCPDEFNSLWETEPMYPAEFSDDATIAEFLISMSPNFRLFYLLPIPDFFMSLPPPEEVETLVAVMQSNDRLLGTRSFAGHLTIPSGTTGTSVLLLNDASINDRVISCRGRFSLNSDDVRNDNYLISMSNISASGLAPFTDVGNYAATLIGSDTDPAQVAELNATWANFAADTLYLNVQPIISAQVGHDLNYVIILSGFTNTSLLVNPDVTTCYGLVSDTIGTKDIRFVGQTVVVDAEIESTLSVSVVDQPVHVIIDEQPVQVIIADQPIEVTVDVDNPIAITGRVQGVSSPDTPVFVSSYFT